PEHVKDAAAVLSRYVQALAIRSAPAGRSWSTDRRDEGIRAWAEAAEVPVINMESALWHPLQALADLVTLREALGELKGKKLAIVWTRSPDAGRATVVHSLLMAAARSGLDVRIAHPPGFELDAEVMSEAQTLAGQHAGASIRTTSREEAVEGAQVVYARSWPSLEDYGNDTLSASRRSRTQGWLVDENLMARGDDARLMHPMPVRRNLEVTDEVLDGPRSLLVTQAENRLHSQKALLSHMLGQA
ncbi:MAG: acetylornithine carbamoyltransferase, partial [Planctomycetota bacterium]